MKTVSYLLMLACLSGCQTTRVDPSESVVVLKYESLPGTASLIAVHPCFEVIDANCRLNCWEGPGSKCWGHRYEVAQNRTLNNNYLHHNLVPPGSSIAGNIPWIAHTWRGEEADRIIQVIDGAHEHYPYADTYRAWPGPNSNTFAAWVLRTAGVSADLHPQAIGKDYMGLVGVGVTTTGTGIQFETPILGFKIGLLDGIEFHLFGFTFGIDFWPPAIKTPFGRFGFPE